MRHPDVIFLSEAFTRPKVMKALAKLGFTQSYTYFTWRTAKRSCRAYLSELTGYPEREYFRPNFFVNTPDILPFQLQTRRAVDVQVARRARRDAVVELRHLQRLRAARARADPRPGGISQFGEIRDQDARLEQARQHQGLYRRGSTRSGAPTRRCCRPATCASCRSTTTNVIGFVKEFADGDNAVAVAIALAGDGPQNSGCISATSRSAAEATQPVRAIENLLTGERHLLEWGGVRLRIDPAHDPALLFRCIA